MPKFIKNQSTEKADHKLKPYCFPKMPENMPTATQSSVQNDSSSDQFRLSSFSSQDNNRNVSLEAKNIEDEAYHQGFKKGETDGYQQVESQLQNLMSSLSEALTKVEEANKSICRAAEEESVNLAIAIAEKILQSEIQTNKEALRNIVTAALKKVMDHKQIKIRCSKQDCETLKEHIPELLKINDHFETIKLEEDVMIEMGGCVVETEFGDIDARIDKQLKVINDAFSAETQRMKYIG